jgi:glycosyltransferase involved in cell wall biosynthesis
VKPRRLPLRVLHVIPSTALRFGGPSVAIGPMCTALGKLPGVSVELATTKADGDGGPANGSAASSGLVTHVFKRTLSERWKFSPGLWRWLRRHAAEYDLIHIHAVWSFASYTAGAAARRAGVPYVIRPAGMLSPYTWSRRAVAKSVYWRLFERRTVRGAAAFHATSTEEAKEIAAIHPGAKTAVIPNGVDPAAWEVAPDTGALRRLCGPAAGSRPILLFLSRLHPKKGVVDLLLPALARLTTDAFLAIVGGSDSHEPDYPDLIRQEIDRLGLKDRAAMLGPVPAAERWALYDGAAAFVLPSHSENFGIVVSEAMARGCPVIVSEAVQAAEHVLASKAGLVVPLDVTALADAMAHVLHEPDARDKFGTAGRSYARDRFAWDRIAGEIFSLYQSCF